MTPAKSNVKPKIGVEVRQHEYLRAHAKDNSADRRAGKAQDLFLP